MGARRGSLLLLAVTATAAAASHSAPAAAAVRPLTLFDRGDPRNTALVAPNRRSLEFEITLGEAGCRISITPYEPLSVRRDGRIPTRVVAFDEDVFTEIAVSGRLSGRRLVLRITLRGYEERCGRHHTVRLHRPARPAPRARYGRRAEGARAEVSADGRRVRLEFWRTPASSSPTRLSPPLRLRRNGAVAGFRSGRRGETVTATGFFLSRKRLVVGVAIAGTHDYEAAEQVLVFDLRRRR